MKLVVQRVTKASVTVNQKVVGQIESGLFVLVGVKKGDTKKEVDFLADKLFKLQVMSDENDKMNLTVGDVKADFLVVSQFTLYAETSGGNRPSFVNAALPDEAKKIYQHFIDKLKEKSLAVNIQVETGSFGDYMEINTQLDGPVTIILES